MSYFTDRWIKFKKETTWGAWSTPDTYPNYLMEWSATTTENKEEEDLIGGSRDYRKRLWLEEEVVGRWVQELVSAKIFEYVLGTISGTGLSATYSVNSTVPSMSIYRGIYPDESGSTVSLGYLGMKVDTAELTIEDTGDIRVELNFAGKGVTIPTALPKGTLNLNETAFAFHNSSINIIYPGPTTLNLDNVQRFVLTINNNLEARYSAGAGSYKAVELREGVMEVTGRISLSGDLKVMESIATNRYDNTLVVYLMKPGSTITTTLKNISFGEIPDEMSGLDPIESEFPFTARPQLGSDAIQIIENNLSSVATLVY